MKEALTRVKQELGEEAIILKSKKVTRGGIFSFLAKEQIEVTAAVDPESKRRDEAEGKIPPNSILSKENNRDKFLLLDIRDEVKSIEGALVEISEHMKYEGMPSLPPALNNYYITMVKNGVKKELAGELTQEVYFSLDKEELTNSLSVAQAVHNKLQSMFTISGPILLDGDSKKNIVMIGPTGVGKTTTIAKIAAQLRFFQGKKVALISADTYRMAAIEQLRTFARIASIAIEVVYQPKDMPPAINKHKDKDVILIDTAGRSHHDRDKMRELEDFLEAAQPDQTHLTLCAGTKMSDLLDIIDRFQAVLSQHLLITKLDETVGFGSLLNLAHHRPKAFSFLTIGQNVPDDIALAEKSLLARLVLSSELKEAEIVKGIHVRPSEQTEGISIH